MHRFSPSLHRVSTPRGSCSDSSQVTAPHNSPSNEAGHRDLAADSPHLCQRTSRRRSGSSAGMLRAEDAGKMAFGTPSYPSPLDRLRSGRRERAAQLGLGTGAEASFEVNQSFPKAHHRLPDPSASLSADNFLCDGVNDVSFSPGHCKGSFTATALEQSPLHPHTPSWSFYNFVGGGQMGMVFPTAVRNPNKAICTIDAASSEILTANEMACELFGFAQSELLGMELKQLLRLKSQQPLALSEQFLESDGQVLSLSGKVVDVLDSNGLRMPLSLWVKKLEMSGGLQRCLCVMEPVERTVGTVVFDSQGEVLGCDKEMALIHGFGSHWEMTGLLLKQLIPSIQLPQPGKSLAKSVRRQQATGRTNHGATFPLCIAVSRASSEEDLALVDPEAHIDPNMTMYVGVEWVFANISGMICFNPDGIIHSINPSFARIMFGYDHRDLVGKDISCLIPDFYDILDLASNGGDEDLPMPPLDEEEREGLTPPPGFLSPLKPDRGCGEGGQHPHSISDDHGNLELGESGGGGDSSLVERFQAMGLCRNRRQEEAGGFCLEKTSTPRVKTAPVPSRSLPSSAELHASSSAKCGCHGGTEQRDRDTASPPRRSRSPRKLYKITKGGLEKSQDESQFDDGYEDLDSLAHLSSTFSHQNDSLLSGISFGGSASSEATGNDADVSGMLDSPGTSQVLPSLEPSSSPTSAAASPLRDVSASQRHAEEASQSGAATMLASTPLPCSTEEASEAAREAITIDRLEFSSQLSPLPREEKAAEGNKVALPRMFSLGNINSQEYSRLNSSSNRMVSPSCVVEGISREYRENDTSNPCSVDVENNDPLSGEKQKDRSFRERMQEKSRSIMSTDEGSSSSMEGSFARFGEKVTNLLPLYTSRLLEDATKDLSLDQSSSFSRDGVESSPSSGELENSSTSRNSGKKESTSDMSSLEEMSGTEEKGNTAGTTDVAASSRAGTEGCFALPSAWSKEPSCVAGYSGDVVPSLKDLCSQVRARLPEGAPKTVFSASVALRQGTGVGKLEKGETHPVVILESEVSNLAKENEAGDKMRFELTGVPDLSQRDDASKAFSLCQRTESATVNASLGAIWDRNDLAVECKEPENLDREKDLCTLVKSLNISPRPLCSEDKVQAKDDDAEHDRNSDVVMTETKPTTNPVTEQDGEREMSSKEIPEDAETDFPEVVRAALSKSNESFDEVKGRNADGQMEERTACKNLHEDESGGQGGVSEKDLPDDGTRTGQTQEIKSGSLPLTDNCDDGSKPFLEDGSDSRALTEQSGNVDKFVSWRNDLNESEGRKSNEIPPEIEVERRPGSSSSTSCVVYTWNLNGGTVEIILKDKSRTPEPLATPPSLLDASLDPSSRRDTDSGVSGVGNSKSDLSGSEKLGNGRAGSDPKEVREVTTPGTDDDVTSSSLGVKDTSDSWQGDISSSVNDASVFEGGTLGSEVECRKPHGSEGEDSVGGAKSFESTDLDTSANNKSLYVKHRRHENDDESPLSPANTGTCKARCDFVDSDAGSELKESAETSSLMMSVTDFGHADPTASLSENEAERNEDVSQISLSVASPEDSIVVYPEADSSFSMVQLEPQNDEDYQEESQLDRSFLQSDSSNKENVNPVEPDLRGEEEDEDTSLLEDFCIRCAADLNAHTRQERAKMADFRSSGSREDSSNADVSSDSTDDSNASGSDSRRSGTGDVSQTEDQAAISPAASSEEDWAETEKGDEGGAPIVFPEGSFIGQAEHKDGSFLGVLFEIKHVQLTSGDCPELYCLWMTRDPNEPGEGSRSCGSLTLASSLSAMDQSQSSASDMPRKEPQTSPDVEQESNESEEAETAREESSPSSGLYGQEFDTLNIIGKGAYGFVKLATRKSDGQTVVVKFIRKSKLPENSYVVDNELGAVPLEVSLLSRLDHPNIVKMLNVFENASFVQLVMEKHGSGMDLFEFIDRNPSLDEPLASYFFRQMVSAVSYLHSMKILHRDIKDENIIVDEFFQLKLIDFGAATVMVPGKLFGTFCGTLEYCSPEVLMGNRYRGPELEVWALGVTLYTVVFGENPFYDVDETIKAVLKPPWEVSHALLYLLCGLLHHDPEQRFTVEEVEENCWVNQPINIAEYQWSEVIPNHEFHGNTAADSRRNTSEEDEEVNEKKRAAYHQDPRCHAHPDHPDMERCHPHHSFSQ